MPRTIFSIALGLSLLLTINSIGKTDSVQSQKFGKTTDGKTVTLYTLTDKSGASVSIMNYGATVMRIKVPDDKVLFGRVAGAGFEPAAFRL